MSKIPLIFLITLILTLLNGTAYSQAPTYDLITYQTFCNNQQFCLYSYNPTPLEEEFGGSCVNYSTGKVADPSNDGICPPGYNFDSVFSKSSSSCRTVFLDWSDFNNFNYNDCQNITPTGPPNIFCESNPNNEVCPPQTPDSDEYALVDLTELKAIISDLSDEIENLALILAGIAGQIMAVLLVYLTLRTFWEAVK